MVIEVDTRSSGMPPNSVRMSSRESIATPTLPTSPAPCGVGVVAHLGRQVEGHRQPGRARPRAAACSGRWTPRPCRIRRTDASSTAGRCTSWGRPRGCTGTGRGRQGARPAPSRRAPPARRPPRSGSPTRTAAAGQPTRTAAAAHPTRTTVAAHPTRTTVAAHPPQQPRPSRSHARPYSPPPSTPRPPAHPLRDHAELAPRTHHPVRDHADLAHLATTTSGSAYPVGVGSQGDGLAITRAGFVV